MDYRDNRQRWAESHQVVHFYAGQWCTFTPALTFCTSTPARQTTNARSVSKEETAARTGDISHWMLLYILTGSVWV